MFLVGGSGRVTGVLLLLLRASPPKEAYRPAADSAATAPRVPAPEILKLIVLRGLVYGSSVAGTPSLHSGRAHGSHREQVDGLLLLLLPLLPVGALISARA